jgi:hypothetical protein
MDFTLQLTDICFMVSVQRLTGMLYRNYDRLLAYELSHKSENTRSELIRTVCVPPTRLQKFIRQLPLLHKLNMIYYMYKLNMIYYIQRRKYRIW